MKIVLKTLLWSFVALAVVGLGVQAGTETTFFTSYLPRLLFSNNFAPVVEGSLYRSAEMDRSELTKIVRAHQIKTVIDLRAGSNKIDGEGFTEDQTMKELGGQYLHIPMFASRVPSQEKLFALLDALRDQPHPVLIHCTSGTHRSGVAAALWLLDQQGASRDAALEQLSARFGYYPLERQMKAWLQGQPTLDSIIFRYAEDSRSESITIRDWIRREIPTEAELAKTATSHEQSLRQPSLLAGAAG